MHTRKIIGALAAILVGAFSLAVWAESSDPPEGLTGEASYDGLYRAADTALKEVWMKPDLQFDGRYTHFLVDSEVPISYKDTPRSSSTTASARSRSANFALTDNQKAEMSNMFFETMIEALEGAQNIELTDTPGPHVLLLQAQLIDLVVRIPTTPSTGRSSFYVAEIGDVTMVLEFRDSQTNEIFIRALDRRAMQTIGGRGTMMFSPTQAKPDVRRLFSNWAAFVAERVDFIKQMVIDALAE